MNDLETIAARIAEFAARSKSDHLFFHGAVSEDRLVAAERKLGVTITGSFKAFLLCLGGAYMLGYPFAGLPDDIQGEDVLLHYCHIADTTEMYRDFMEDLPRSFVYITEDGGEITFWVDTAIIEDGEQPVFAHLYGKYYRMSHSFLGFVDLLTRPQDIGRLFA